MTLAWVLLAMNSLIPGKDHSVLAAAVTRVVSEERPLFRDDESRLRTGALVVAVMYRESAFRLDAIGDQGRAWCAMQLWSAPKEVLTDPELCVRIGLQRLRESVSICGMGNVLGIYSVGPTGCSSETAKRISRDRMAIATRLVRVVAEEGPVK